MTAPVIITILDHFAARAAINDLADVLVACVEGGASVGFMQPYRHEDAVAYWEKIAEDVEAGRLILIGAQIRGRTVGTVQVAPSAAPNQPHRADLRKLLIHPEVRGQGLSRELMQAAEAAAVKRGLSLLVLDTATGSDAEAIYPRFGWQRAGVIPDYALWPQGGYCDTTLFYKQIAAHR